MGEIIAMLALMVLCVVGCFAIARRVAMKLSRSAVVLLAGMIAAAMLLFARYLSDSVFVASIVPTRMLPVFGNWLAPLAGMLAGTGWVLSSRPPGVRSAIFGLLMVLSFALPYGRLFGPRPQVAERWEHGVCLQTNQATCGAAAAAGLLKTVGIDASEREMVELCFSSDRGTSLHGMLRGLSVKLSDSPWQVKAVSLSEDELAQLEMGCILEVGLDSAEGVDARYTRDWGWTPGVSHTVVLYGVRPDGKLEIGDPAAGRELWNPDALKVLWKNIAIVLVPK